MLLFDRGFLQVSIEKIQEAVDKDDKDGMYRLAHSQKGAVAIVGLDRLDHIFNLMQKAVPAKQEHKESNVQVYKELFEMLKITMTESAAVWGKLKKQKKYHIAIQEVLKAGLPDMTKSAPQKPILTKSPVSMNFSPTPAFSSQE